MTDVQPTNPDQHPDAGGGSPDAGGDSIDRRIEKELAEGRYAALEDSTNSIAVSDQAYIGVSDEYKNYANDSDEPLLAEDNEEVEKLEQRAIDNEAALKASAGSVHPRTGFTVDPTHPSEATKPQDRYIEGNRALMDAAVKDSSGKTP